MPEESANFGFILSRLSLDPQQDNRNKVITIPAKYIYVPRLEKKMLVVVLRTSRINAFLHETLFQFIISYLLQEMYYPYQKIVQIPLIFP